MREAINDIVLNDVSLTLAANCVLSRTSMRLTAGRYRLTGVNGVGKSSFLAMLCGLIAPTSGEVKVATQPELVSDFIEIPPDLTMRSVFALYDQYQRCDAVLRAQLVNQFQCTEHLGKAIHALSQGTVQKLKLILALSGKGDWLLLDEAFNGLDHASVTLLNQLLLHTDKPWIVVDHAGACTVPHLTLLQLKDASLCIGA